MNAARRSGHGDGEIALALHEALPGDAVIYLDQRAVNTMDLDDMLWHLELLYRSRMFSKPGVSRDCTRESGKWKWISGTSLPVR